MVSNNRGKIGSRSFPWLKHIDHFGVVVSVENVGSRTIERTDGIVVEEAETGIEARSEPKAMKIYK